MRTPQKICHLRSAHISRPSHNPPHRPAQTTQPTWPLSRSAHACLWRILQKTFSSLIHAFCSRRLLSLPSLTHGPRLSVLSSTPCRPTPIAQPPSPAAFGLSAPPLHTSRCRPEPSLAPPSPPSSCRALTRRDEPIYSAIEATPRRSLPHLHRPDTRPPDPIKGHLHPRSIPHLSHPSPALLPSSPLASIGASTAARSTPLRAHLRPSSASPMSPPASPSSPTPPWRLTVSFSASKHRSGRSSVTPLQCSPAMPPTAAVALASFFQVIESKMDAPD
jgi:hypothetical protein